MTLQMITGRSGSGKSKYLEDVFIDEEMKDPSGPPLLYLVPDQMTFQAEKRFLKRLGKGTTRIRVTGFSRLAHMIIQEQGGGALVHLKQTGVNMLLRKITEDHKSEFRVFEHATGTSGFIDKLESMITECKRYNQSAEDIEAMAEDESLPGGLKDKLYDLSLIMNRINEQTASVRLASEDDFSLAIEQVKHSEMLKEAMIAIDGYHHFSPLEEAFLHELMTVSKQVSMALTLDKLPHRAEVLDPFDLFFETANTAQRILIAANHLQIGLKPAVHFDERTRFQKKGLRHLEAMSHQRPADPSDDHSGVNIVAAVNKRAEIRFIAREIRRLVRQENYRYKDIAVLSRNPDDYRDLIEHIFEEEQIPVFVDAKRSAIHHPLIEFVRSLLDMVSKNWRYDDVIRCLKTELTFPVDQSVTRKHLDTFENITLALGMNGYQWYDREQWGKRLQFYRAAKEGEEDHTITLMHNLHKIMVDPLIQFHDKITSQNTVNSTIEALFNLLVALSVPEKLAFFRDQALDKGRLQEARDHDQIWKELISIFDQASEACGQDKMNLITFNKMLDTGLESISYSIIPPALDQVVAASMATSRLSDISCTFLIGANDGVIPMPAEESTFMSDRERVTLLESGHELAPAAERQLLNEQYLVYQAQTSPKDRLIISYLLSDDEGKAKQPSIILNHLKEMFPELKTEVAVESPADLDISDEDDYFISSPEGTKSFLAERLQRWKRGYPLPDIWWSVYNWYMSERTYASSVRTSLTSLFYDNNPGSLSKTAARGLYGQKMTASVSRLEQYYSCAFKQFANYGLRLREREYFRLDAPDIGILFHDALKELTANLKQEGRSFIELSEPEAVRRSKNIVENLAPKINRNILKSSSRLRYILSKLEQVVIRAAMIMMEQAKRTGFQPEAVELGFGTGSDLPPLSYTLDDGTTVELAGRIDRVDSAKTPEGFYIRVIDYKSSKTDLSLSDVYYGLAMQMLVYLDAIMKNAAYFSNGDDVIPAGMLYFHVHNPVIKSDSGKLTPEEAAQRMLKEFKMKGLILNEEEAVDLTDLTMGDSADSDIAPLKRNKNGSLAKKSKVIDREHLEAGRRFIETQIKQASSAILSGDISINPYRRSNQTPCTFCSFRSLCQFDPALPTNSYRDLKKLSDDQVIDMIQTREEGE